MEPKNSFCCLISKMLNFDSAQI